MFHIKNLPIEKCLQEGDYFSCYLLLFQLNFCSSFSWNTTQYNVNHWLWWMKHSWLCTSRWQSLNREHQPGYLPVSARCFLLLKLTCCVYMHLITCKQTLVVETCLPFWSESALTVVRIFLAEQVILLFISSQLFTLKGFEVRVLRMTVWLCRLCWAGSAGSSGWVFLHARWPPRFRSVVVNANLSLCRLCRARSAGQNCWVFLHTRWSSWFRSVRF